MCSTANTSNSGTFPVGLNSYNGNLSLADDEPGGGRVLCTCSGEFIRSFSGLLFYVLDILLIRVVWFTINRQWIARKAKWFIF